MTPIEIAAKAAYESTGMYSWDEVYDKARVCRAMRVALLALAECELPDEAIDDAEEARIEAIEAHSKHQAEVWANIGKPIPEKAKGTAAFTWMPPTFKALLRSIATEGKDNG